MLLKKSLISKGTVVSMKLVNGDEIICRYEGEDDAGITVSKPLAITASNQGLGMIPWVFLGNVDEYTLNKNHVFAMVPSKTEAADQYSQNTTSIALI